MHAKGKLGGEKMPEDVIVPIVPKEERLNILTLGMALNYQRSSYTLWEAISKLYKDHSARWVFCPEQVLNCEMDELQSILFHYRVALQPNRHPEIWKRVAAGIFHSSSKGDVEGLLESTNYDILELKSVVQKQRKSEFPYLSGPKIFNYWVYVLESYHEIAWKSRELITIAPDTHILKASIKLGVCEEGVLKGSGVDRESVSQSWKVALEKSGIAPIDIHTPLWLWSRADFPSITY